MLNLHVIVLRAMGFIYCSKKVLSERRNGRGIIAYHNSRVDRFITSSLMKLLGRQNWHVTEVLADQKT